MSIEAMKFREGADKADRERNEATLHPAGVHCVADLSYGPYGVWNLLNVYCPEGAEGLLPVIVSIHGGGYVYGTKEVYHHYCADLARRGFAVVNFNYRLAPENRFPAQLEDINSAFCWVAEHAGEHHMDLKNLFVVGDSAGAQMASQYAAILTDQDYGALFSFEPAPVKIKALGLNCGMYDLYAKMTSPTFRLGVDYLGEDFDLKDARLKVLDAINSHYPPAHITTAICDFNRKEAQPFAEYLRQKGITACWECYGTPEREMGHVFHVDIRMPEAHSCNDAQCAFFRNYLQN